METTTHVQGQEVCVLLAADEYKFDKLASKLVNDCAYFARSAPASSGRLTKASRPRGSVDFYRATQVLSLSERDC